MGIRDGGGWYFDSVHWRGISIVVTDDINSGDESSH